jgi:hypothetical protein
MTPFPSHFTCRRHAIADAILPLSRHAAAAAAYLILLRHFLRRFVSIH